MKTRVLIKEGQYRLNKAGCLDPKVDSEELFSFLTGMDRVEVFLQAEEEVDPEIQRKYLKLIKKREERVPLQHITGEQEFMGFNFEVSEDVLIPRQDTETLVTEGARILRDLPPLKRSLLDKIRGRNFREVLDLCCGSGIVGVSLGRICEDIHITASDVSQSAVALTKKNAEANRVEIDAVQGDLFGPHGGKRFDMILTNPPYIKSNMIGLLQDEIKVHEPREALDGGRDGLDFYRKIITQAPSYLKPEGYLLMEIGYDQGEDVRKLLDEAGVYNEIEVIQDLAGKERVVRCRKK